MPLLFRNEFVQVVGKRPENWCQKGNQGSTWGNDTSLSSGEKGQVVEFKMVLKFAGFFGSILCWESWIYYSDTDPMP